MPQAFDGVDERVMVKMRRLLGVKQQQMALATRIQRSRLSAWENGRVSLNEDELQAMAEFIDKILLERSEARTLPETGVVGLDSKERGRRFRALREQWGVAQGEVAERAGLFQNYVSMYERGFMELTPDQQEKADKALAFLIDKKAAAGKRFATALKLDERQFPEGTNLLLGTLPAPDVAAEQPLSRLTLTELVRRKRLMEEKRRAEDENVLLKKQLKISEEKCALHEKIADMRLGQANEMAAKLDELSDRLSKAITQLPQGPGRDEVRRIVGAMKAALEE